MVAQNSLNYTAEGLLSTALTRRKFTYVIGVPRNFGSRQNKIQKKKLFLFPDLQETVDTPVVVELMKNRLPNLKHETGTRKGQESKITIESENSKSDSTRKDLSASLIKAKEKKKKTKLY